MCNVAIISRYPRPGLAPSLASHPGLLTSAFIAFRTNVGKPGKLVTCNDVPGCRVDVWRSGTFLLYSAGAVSEPKKRHQDCLMSTALLLRGPWLRSVECTLTCSFLGHVQSTLVGITGPQKAYDCVLVV